MYASLQTAQRMTARLLVVVAVMTAATAALCAPGAMAATTVVYADIPPGLCQGNQITVLPPTDVLASYGDKQIAWRAHLWQASNGRWVYDSSTNWQWATVSYGHVYPPYNQSAGWTINRAGAYAVTVEMYSYGQRKYITQDINLRHIGTFFDESENYYCQFG